MSKKYNTLSQENLKSVFKNSSPELLRQYFDNNNLLAGVDFEEEKKQKKVSGFVDFLIDEIEKIEIGDTRNKIKSELQKVFVMRDKNNLLRYIRGEDLERETIEMMEATDNNFDKSLIIFLNEKNRFDDLYFAYDADHYNKRSWGNARNDYLDESKELTSDIEEQLIEAAKQHLERKNRGKKFCNKRVSLADKEYIFAFYEDLPQEQLKIEGNDVETYFSNPVGKIVILYDRKHKFVKIYGEDDYIKNKMHQAFAKCVFSKDHIEEEQAKNEVYDLKSIFDQLVQNGNINFNNRSAIIQKIIPLAIRLKNIHTNDSIELFVGEKNGEIRNLCDVIKDFIGIDESSKNAISYEEIEPSWVSLKIFYQDQFDSKKTTAKTIKITCKNKVQNLGEEDIDFDIINCFKDSKILMNKK